MNLIVVESDRQGGSEVKQQVNKAGEFQLRGWVSANAEPERGERLGARSAAETDEHGSQQISQSYPIIDCLRLFIQLRRRETLSAVDYRKVTDQAHRTESREYWSSPVVEEHRGGCHRSVRNTNPVQFPYCLKQWHQYAYRFSRLDRASDCQ